MSPRDEIRLFIVIPVYGNWGDTLATLEALAVQDCGQFRVLIADDGTPSEAPPEIHGFGFAQYTKMLNAGFAGNCNRAARLAIDEGATHLLFLNSDTDFSPQFVSGWRRMAAQMPHAIVSPLVYWYSKPQTVWYSGGKMTILTPFVRLTRKFSQTTQVDIVCGCTLMVPVSAWERLRGFDDRFAVYFEDFDLALRAKSAGISVFVAAEPELRVWHKVSGSFRRDKLWEQQYLMLTSRLVFIRLHFRGPKRFLCYILAGPHLLAMFIKCYPETPSPRLMWRAVVRGTSIPGPRRG